MTNPTAPKQSIKTRIKHRTPEIIVGVTAVAGLVGLIYIRKSLNAQTVSAFAKNAADDSVEIITGSEEAFVVMSEVAMSNLRDIGSIDVHDGEHFRLALSYFEK